MIPLNLRYYRWFPPEKHLGHTTERVDLDLATTAFLLVDVYCPEPDRAFMQGAVSNGFLQIWYDITVGRIAPALRSARAVGLPIILSLIHI